MPAPMCDALLSVTSTGFRGENSTFRVVGVSIVIGRKAGIVILEYKVVMASLVLAAIGTLLLPADSSRTNLVATEVLSAIFVIMSASDTTPHAEAGYNLVLWYCFLSLLFIFITYIWQCLGFYIKIWPNSLLTIYGKHKNIFNQDKLFFLFLLAVYVIFNIIFWEVFAKQSGKTCDNAVTDSDAGLVSCQI